ncbi:hypothetical protein EXIGLDRAFT_762628 [Exidia glandulosa HHB12029]|uniref:Uncharacterized protein n=1 Tax=Exidia glandulosa HHB12029 TaxID=1314781 RepID=A0A165MNU4_EXIGL|nr:hypothetical protein EXIGLDRAFT_762628 [Exidia glandulosa HHB12029]
MSMQKSYTIPPSVTDPETSWEGAWLEPNTLIPRGNISGVLDEASQKCASPPGNDSILLSSASNATADNRVTARLVFRGYDVTVYGGRSSMMLSSEPWSLARWTLDGTAQYYTPPETDSLKHAPVACDVVLAKFAKLDPKVPHTLDIELIVDPEITATLPGVYSEMFIYNATVTEALPESRAVIALYVCSPLFPIVCFGLVIRDMIMRHRRRRKVQTVSYPRHGPICAYPCPEETIQSPDTATTTRDMKNSLFRVDEKAPVRDARSPSSDAGFSLLHLARSPMTVGTSRQADDVDDRVPEVPDSDPGLAELGTAITRAGFSVTALLASLHRVHHGVDDVETGVPPTYDGSMTDSP